MPEAQQSTSMQTPSAQTKLDVETPVVENKNEATHKSIMSSVLSRFSRRKVSQNVADVSNNTLGEKPRKLGRWHIVAGIFLVLLLLSTVVGVYTYATVRVLRAQATEAVPLARTTYDQFKAQNLVEVQNNLTQLDQKLNNIESTYAKLAFYKYVPIARGYYNDGQHALTGAKAGLDAAEKTAAAVTPYADVLGFTGEGSFTGGTAEDRLKIILETLDKVAPELDAITADLLVLESEMAAIDPSRYPESLQGKPVRSYVVQAQEVSAGAVTALTEFRPVLEQLPSIAGGRGERKKYLILFMNDNELRPTGGFLTAYAVINVEDGKVVPEKSDDIYELDKKFNGQIPIPDALGRYLTTERYWNLRDMNISPDFKVSMEQFFEHYSEVPGEPDNIDGIIGVNTEFLTDLLTVLGPVEVPGYGTFTAEIDPSCDCPQIIHVLSEIITRPTPFIRENRKGIIGPLMRAILTKAYGAPKQQWPELFRTGFANIEGRHVQFFFLDERSQQAAEAALAAGRMRTPEENTDFLAIINSNLGGAKSNLYTSYDVEQVISAPENGMLEKTVTITYRNDHPADNCNLEAGLLCLNSTLRDWTRLYVPAGSQLVAAQGFTEEAKVYEENGFTVIDGFFTLEPLGTSKLQITYQVPYTDTVDYRGYVWKQGGIELFEMLMEVTGGQEKIQVVKDIEYKTAF